jgi:hypothetical protein
MITIASCFVMGKATGCGTSQNAGPDLAISLWWAPCFQNAPYLGALPYTDTILIVAHKYF